jgi:periodic tryptophan protein 1
MSTLASPESPEATLERVQKLAAELPEAETAETSMLLSETESVSDMTPVPEEPVSAPKLHMDVEDEFNLADYDDEPVVNTSGYFQHLDADLRLNSKKDPHQNYDALSDSEDGDFYEVKTSDVLFAAATAEEEQCYVEVYVHDTETGALFVRQTFDLNAYPLTMEFCSTASDAAYLAVGTFDHAIELWDLRELSPDEPAGLLGMSAPKKTNKKKKKPVGLKTLGHTDAVLSLSAGRGGVLVSGSADKTVRLWDVNTLKHISEFNHHSDKVQSVLVHPQETNVVLTASYDRCAAVLDMRTSNAVKKIPIGAGSDPEALMWLSDYEFLVSTESGAIRAFDLRTAGQAGQIWTAPVRRWRRWRAALCRWALME